VRQGWKILPHHRCGLRGRVRPFAHGGALIWREKPMQQNVRLRFAALVLCGVFAVTAGAFTVKAQPGSAGGTIGNSEKSISGTRAVPPPDASQPPAAEPPAARSRPPAAARRPPPKKDRAMSAKASKDVCERRCLQVRQACNKTKGGYFNGCGIDAAACITRC
jgi:hypothetical protein